MEHVYNWVIKNEKEPYSSVQLSFINNKRLIVTFNSNKIISLIKDFTV